MYSVGGAGAKSLGHAASPPAKNRAASVNSSKKNKQLQTYDPAFAGKQIAGQADVGQNIGRGSQYAGHGGPNHPDGRRRPPAAEGNMPRQPANAPPQQYQNQADPGAQYQGGGPRDDRYDDGDSALERAGYMRDRKSVV